MIKVDLHVHSIRSYCGEHTLLELVHAAGSLGMTAFALTDHGTALGTFLPHFSVFCRRMPGIIDGIRVLKGIEANVMDMKGGTDIPEQFREYFEVIVLGLHSVGKFTKSRGIGENTAALIHALEKNPDIILISHPALINYPVDIDTLADCACEHGAALEISNSNQLNGKDDPAQIRRILELAEKGRVSISFNSDAHVISELGRDNRIEELLKDFDRSRMDIINDRILDQLAPPQESISFSRS